VLELIQEECYNIWQGKYISGKSYRRKLKKKKLFYPQTTCAIGHVVFQARWLQNRYNTFFDVLLTVRLSVFISVINQLDAHNCCFYNKFYFMPLHVSSTVVFIVMRSKLYYTASGIITLCRWPSGAQVLSQPVHRTATYRCDDTRCCIIQFWPPDDEHNSARNM